MLQGSFLYVLSQHVLTSGSLYSRCRFQVFELLLRLLPAFSRENWESTIRRYVNIHPEYSDLTPWDGRETADITYHDRDGVLTGIFIDKGYLNSGIWNGRRPKYFIEVKSTTGSCERPFFMSKNQYQTVSNAIRYSNLSLFPGLALT